MRVQKTYWTVALMLLIAVYSFAGSLNTNTGLSLKELGAKRNVLIGTTATAWQLIQDGAFSDIAVREFDIVTPENAMKFGNIHRTEKAYDFGEADAIVDFCLSNNLKVRGHTLVWHTQLPGWVEIFKNDKGRMKKIMKDHIKTVVGHYKGKVAYWDVVNEAVRDEDGELRETVWYKSIGKEYFKLAFKWAREADPKAKLFYNDYASEIFSKKSDGIYALMQYFKKEHIPIDGIGFQMHLDLANPPSREVIVSNLNRFADLGLEIHVTEMDVKTMDFKGTKKQMEKALAQVYQDVFAACLSVKNFKNFTLWGLTDKYTWLSLTYGSVNYPLIFDNQYKPKESYYGMKRALEGM